jgi:hypothetical protein
MAKTVEELTAENNQLKAGGVLQSKKIASLEGDLQAKAEERKTIIAEAQDYKGWSWRLLSTTFGLNAHDLTAMTTDQIEAKVVEYENAAHTYEGMKMKADEQEAIVADNKAAARSRLKNGTSTDPEGDLKIVES